MERDTFSFLFFLLLVACVVKAQIRVSSDLDCNFSSHCRWSNGSMAGSTLPENIGWGLIGDAQADDRFPLSDGKAENTFAFTSAPGGRHEIWLVSDVIGCQLGGARLKFWYYFTGKNGKLDVCTRFPPGTLDMSKIHCYEPASNSRLSNGLWLILIKATFESPNDLIAIDDITYEAILCESVSSGMAQGAGGKIDQVLGDETYTIQQIMSSIDDRKLNVHKTPSSLLKEFSNVRSAPTPTSLHNSKYQAQYSNGEISSNCGLDCDFDTNHLCNYQSLEKEGTSQKAWTLSNRPVSNPLTGIQQDSRGKGGYFAYAGNSNNAEHIFVLKSNKKLIQSLGSNNTTLHFDYYLAGVRGRLLVCFATHDQEDDLDISSIIAAGARLCHFEQNGVHMRTDSRQWKTASVVLPESVQQILFIADNLPKNYIIGLDEIHLMDKYGRIPASCVSTRSVSSSTPPHPSMWKIISSELLFQLKIVLLLM
uniref:MAM domain-containing protein n=1 Tax=Ditylenchus dipsaci TaxID=166011 RepID=A0A915EPE1_9BILA